MMERLVSVILAAAIAVGSTAGCSPSADAILSKYKNYAVTENSDNKAELREVKKWRIYLSQFSLFVIYNRIGLFSA